MNNEMALKSRSYNLDLHRVRLSFGIFLFSELFNGDFFYQLSGSNFIFVKNTHQKAANLMFHLISPVARTPAWFLEGQSSGAMLAKVTLWFKAEKGYLMAQGWQRASSGSMLANDTLRSKFGGHFGTIPLIFRMS